MTPAQSPLHHPANPRDYCRLQLRMGCACVPCYAQPKCWAFSSRQKPLWKANQLLEYLHIKNITMYEILWSGVPKQVRCRLCTDDAQLSAADATPVASRSQCKTCLKTLEIFKDQTATYHSHKVLESSWGIQSEPWAGFPIPFLMEGHKGDPLMHCHRWQQKPALYLAPTSLDWELPWEQECGQEISATFCPRDQGIHQQAATTSSTLWQITMKASTKRAPSQGVELTQLCFLWSLSTGWRGRTAVWAAAWKGRAGRHFWSLEHRRGLGEVEGRNPPWVKWCQGHLEAEEPNCWGDKERKAGQHAQAPAAKNKGKRKSSTSTSPHPVPKTQNSES